MRHTNYLGSPEPSLILYLPHRPEGLDELINAPDAQRLMANNSNHWRKIVTLLAKVASPHEEWRSFRDDVLFEHTALCFSVRLQELDAWHWIGGKDNLQRFSIDGLNAKPLRAAPDVALDPEKQILLTPYPDYRQLSNATVTEIREALDRAGFYDENL
ncbi:hypothetical protein [Microbulbifer sp. ALW1]|uniref:DUF6942 family protein n=1 Tax=Microbulbifer sp. (strain ALW1) TaxID=1516059 RepID=UPI0013599C05|nr:hypothetical protein [Microbulbifer sp. ALW1]